MVAESRDDGRKGKMGEVVRRRIEVLPCRASTLGIVTLRRVPTLDLLPGAHFSRDPTADEMQRGASVDEMQRGASAFEPTGDQMHSGHSSTRESIVPGRLRISNSAAI
jgi:hypothetical protein